MGEVFWIIIYTYVLFLSVYYDLFFLFLLGVYMLILATTESSIGLSLLILRMNIIGTTTVENFGFKNYFFLRKKNNLNIFSKIF